MHNQSLSINTQPAATMTSREIAELTGKRHDNVLRDIRDMVKQLEKDSLSFEETYLDSYGRHQAQYRLDRLHVECLLTGYSIPLRMKVLERLAELEAGAFKVPQTFSDALRLAADQQEKIMQLAHENKSQAEKIDTLENLLAKGMSAPEFCRRLNGVNTMTVNKYLLSKGWLYESQGSYANWRVASYARDQYMTERAIEVQGSAGAFTVSKPVLLKKGARWLIHQYMQGNLPMKQSWDGVYSHDMAGVLGVAV